MISVEGNVVCFRFYRPLAHRVCLAGEFNNWRHHDLPMRKDARGYWVARLRLAAGSYRFRYWADGAWFPDYAAFGLEAGPFGYDSVVRVAPAVTAVGELGLAKTAAQVA